MTQTIEQDRLQAYIESIADVKIKAMMEATLTEIVTLSEKLTMLEDRLSAVEQAV